MKKTISILLILFFCAPISIYCKTPDYVTQTEFKDFVNNLKLNNYISLKDYVDDKIETIKEATNIALVSNEKRLDGMNEFRNSLKDQAAMFTSNVEFDATMIKIDDAINQLRNDIKSLQFSLKDQTFLFISKSEFKITILKIDDALNQLRSDIKSLQLTRAEVEGKASQSAAIFGISVGLLGVVMSGSSLIFVIVTRQKKIKI